jgi:hypothetical protein
MRTKTLLLSALLGAAGTVAVHAQSVYSLNAVGYITVTLAPGFNIVTCPLLTSPDNTVGTVFNNSTGALTGSDVYFYSPSTGQYSGDDALAIGSGRGHTTNANGWGNNGTNVLSPGTACWFENNASTNLTVIFYGTVPSSVTTPLVAGFNLVGSAIPVTGDLVTNSLSAFTNYNIGDDLYMFANGSYYGYSAVPSNSRSGGHGYLGQWTSSGDPTVTNDYQGFWYENNVGTTVNWVENYSVGQ